MEKSVLSRVVRWIVVLLAISLLLVIYATQVIHFEENSEAIDVLNWPPKNFPPGGVRCNSSNAVFDGVPVRIYRQTSPASGLVPAIVFLHGGGWIIGSIDTHHSATQRLCELTGATVVSVGYRLAPKFPFPTPFTDCLRATKFLLSNKNELFGVKTSRVAVAGDSAGGNLAAAVALKLRDERFKPRLKLQLLLYPPLQGIDFRLPSMITNKYGLTARMMCQYTALYIEGSEKNMGVYCNNSHVPSAVRQKYIHVDRLPEKYLRGYVRQEPNKVDYELWNRLKDKLLDPYFSPLVADSLKRLPRTYMLTVDHDCLSDEGQLYVDRLRQDGVNVTHRVDPTGGHGTLHNWQIVVADFIKQNL